MSEDLQTQLNRVATHFRKQADYDYISARANFRMGLRQQFLWAGLQAVEKYLKAILLFNGKSAKKGGHDLEKLCKKVKEIDYLNFFVEECNQRLLAYLSKQGANRYLNIDAYNTMSAIHDLDNLVWDIRRYCQGRRTYLGWLRADEVLKINEANIFEINHDFYKKNKYKFRIHPDGELEKIISGKPSDLKRKALLWANLCYGTKKRNSVTHNTFSSIEPGLQWTEEIEEYVVFPRPRNIKTKRQRALYHNLNEYEELTLDIDKKIKEISSDDWSHIPAKESIIKEALSQFLTDVFEVERIFTIIKQQQSDY